MIRNIFPDFLLAVKKKTTHTHTHIHTHKMCVCVCMYVCKLVDVWTVVTIDYVTWKIVPKLDYLNKEGIFLTV